MRCARRTRVGCRRRPGSAASSMTWRIRSRSARSRMRLVGFVLIGSASRPAISSSRRGMRRVLCGVWWWVKSLGARRTGPLGAVAADVLAPPDANSVAVIGSGHQAWTQLVGVTGRPYAANRPRLQSQAGASDRFVRAAVEDLGLDATAVGSAREAVVGADVIVLATRSRIPVIDAADVSPGAHVTTVGPKTIDAPETPVGLVDAAALVTCDSPGQARSYAAPFFTGERELVDLGAVVCGVERREARARSRCTARSDWPEPRSRSPQHCSTPTPRADDPVNPPQRAATANSNARRETKGLPTTRPRNFWPVAPPTTRVASQKCCK